MTDSTQETLIAVENMTKASISRINSIKATLKVKREMYKSVFDNSDEYREADRVYREARLKRLEVKTKLLEQPETKQLDDDIHRLQDDMKTEQLALSDWLYNYEKQTGSTMVETDEGVTYNIQRTYKAKKESKAARWLRTHPPKKILSEGQVGLDMPAGAIA